MNINKAGALYYLINIYAQGMIRISGNILQAVIQPSMTSIVFDFSQPSGVGIIANIPASIDFLILSGSFEV